MKPFVEILEEERRQQVDFNYRELIKDAQNKSQELLEKIQTHIKERNIPATVDEILARIQTDEIYARSTYIKDYKKQNFHERQQLEYIKQHIPSVVKGGNTIYLKGGKVVSSNDRASSSKSMDFIDIAHGLWFTSKHIDGKGGNQDNQFRDICDTIKEYQKIKEPVPKLVVIISGSYFEKNLIKLTPLATGNVQIINLYSPLASEQLTALNASQPIEIYPGQFYTIHADFIMKNLHISIPDGSTIVEPFVGGGDLIPFCKTLCANPIIEMYDINQTRINATRRDTIDNPPAYKGKYCITNPPYLARNKSKSKDVFIKYKTNDLYKCFLTTLISGDVEGGCLILPLNFWCGNEPGDLILRGKFLSKYIVLQLNIFEEKVFEDTAYSVCSFNFTKSNHICSSQKISATFYPSNTPYQLELTAKTKWIIGYHILNTVPTGNKIKLLRLVAKSTITDAANTDMTRTAFVLHAVDSVAPSSDKFKDGKIRLSVVDPANIQPGKHTDRTTASFSWNLTLSVEQQKRIVAMFNKYLNKYREIYHSLFLSNYREDQRKRISFELATKLIITATTMFCQQNKIPIESILINYALATTAGAAGAAVAADTAGTAAADAAAT